MSSRENGPSGVHMGARQQDWDQRLGNPSKPFLTTPILGQFEEERFEFRGEKVRFYTNVDFFSPNFMSKTFDLSSG